jgi:choline dehydrogenase-like flavoprotein
MFIDSRTLPENTEIQGDVCIIGAGPAGITLALDLASDQRRVVVFESGGYDFNARTQSLYDGESTEQGFIPLDSDRIRFLGGSTNHWSGSCRPFEASDFGGWPFGRPALEDYYRRAQQIVQLGPFSYEPEDWFTGQAARLKLDAGGRFQNRMFQYSSPAMRFGKAYANELKDAANVTVYLHANLVDIDTNGSASEVSGVRLACLGGRRFRARARHYVLATGGIENARLLLSSDRVQKRGLGNEFDVVGRYFSDHPVVYNVSTIRFSSSQPKLDFYDTSVVRGQMVQGYLAPSPTLRKEQQLPAFIVGLSLGTVYAGDNAKGSVQFAYRNLVAGQFPRSLNYHAKNIMRGIERRALKFYYGLPFCAPIEYTTSYSVELPPDPNSRVTLSDAVDALGMRRVKVDWRLPADFMQTLRRAHELLGEELRRYNLGTLRLNASTNTLRAAKNFSSGHHHMGTTRMHADPKQGVVDANCRVHGIGNLYIAGSSVFPTYSSDDPTLTILALTLKLSDHLKSLGT